MAGTCGTRRKFVSEHVMCTERVAGHEPCVSDEFLNRSETTQSAPVCSCHLQNYLQRTRVPGVCLNRCESEDSHASSQQDLSVYLSSSVVPSPFPLVPPSVRRHCSLTPRCRRGILVRVGGGLLRVEPPRVNENSPKIFY